MTFIKIPDILNKKAVKLDDIDGYRIVLSVQKLTNPVKESKITHLLGDNDEYNGSEIIVRAKTSLQAIQHASFALALSKVIFPDDVLDE